MVYEPDVVIGELFKNETRIDTALSPKIISYKMTLFVDDIIVGSLIGNYNIDAFSPYIQEWNKNGVLDLIEIEEIYQGKGYGTLFLYVYIGFMKKIGAIQISAKKQRYDEKLVKFYSQFGFEIENRDMVLKFG